MHVGNFRQSQIIKCKQTVTVTVPEMRVVCAKTRSSLCMDVMTMQDRLPITTLDIQGSKDTVLSCYLLASIKLQDRSVSIGREVSCCSRHQTAQNACKHPPAGQAESGFLSKGQPSCKESA